MLNSIHQLIKAPSPLESRWQKSGRGMLDFMTGTFRHEGTFYVGDAGGSALPCAGRTTVLRDQSPYLLKWHSEGTYAGDLYVLQAYIGYDPWLDQLHVLGWDNNMSEFVHTLGGWNAATERYELMGSFIHHQKAVRMFTKMILCPVNDNYWQYKLAASPQANEDFVELGVMNLHRE